MTTRAVQGRYRDMRAPSPEEERRIREAALDHTIAQTFPASDPPSSIPNPCAPEILEEMEGPPSDTDL
jgi:hypothetical protein